MKSKNIKDFVISWAFTAGPFVCSVAHKLSKAGQKEKAAKITNRVHAMLGLHG
jgi:hypothetical protein